MGRFPQCWRRCWTLLAVCTLLVAFESMAAERRNTSKARALPKNFNSMGEESRVKALSSCFDPAPDLPLLIDSPEKQKIIAGHDLAPPLLKGYIRVQPPSGKCVVIERMTQESDPSSWRPPVKVCRPQDVAFRLGEMDEFSELTWLVRVDGQDQGTRIVWSLPYRIAFVVPYNVPLPADPDPLYILSCEASKTSDYGRRVFVNTFAGERWFIRFPAMDQMVDPGPVFNLDDGTTPLVKNGFGFRASHSRAEKQKRKEAALKAEQERLAGQNPEQTSEPVQAPEKPKERFQPQDFGWKISRFDSFKMAADAFMPDSSVTPGMSGECRYTYETAGAEYPEGGLIECHGADRYAYLYLPLNCLADQKFRQVKKLPPPPPPTPVPTPEAAPPKH